MENIRILAFHQLNIVSGELERGSLEIHVSRRSWQHEAKINMNDMAIYIDQDVIIVPVFDIKEILDQAVACQRLNKIGYSWLPIHSKYLPVNIPKTSLVWNLF